METITEYRKLIEQLKGQKIALKTLKAKTKEELMIAEEVYLDTEEAQFVIHTVAKQTHDKFKVNLSAPVTLALANIFEDPYALDVSFAIKNNASACAIKFKRGESLLSPLDSSGYGAANIASFALRVALWGMAIPKSAPVLILDESFKELSANYHDMAGLMLKEISKDMGLQLILSTHSDTLREGVDRIYNVTIKNRVSKVKRLK